MDALGVRFTMEEVSALEQEVELPWVNGVPPHIAPR